MRKILFALTGTVSGLILLFSYHTSLAGAGALAVPSATGTRTTTLPGAGAATPTPTSGSVPPSGSSGRLSVAPRPATSRYIGDTAQTQWGPVQVRITVRNGRITGATAVQYPNGNGNDQVINSYALPVLSQEAVAAQSAQIDLVSGATVTSVGYVQSLQSALDKAHL